LITIALTLACEFRIGIPTARNRVIRCTNCALYITYTTKRADGFFGVGRCSDDRSFSCGRCRGGGAWSAIASTIRTAIAIVRFELSLDEGQGVFEFNAWAAEMTVGSRCYSEIVVGRECHRGGKCDESKMFDEHDDMSRIVVVG